MRIDAPNARGDIMIIRLKKTASICILTLLVAVPALAGSGVAPKPQQPPTYVEPTGDFTPTDGPQVLLSVASYVRLFDYVDGAFKHTWSGKTGYNRDLQGVIGDINGDGKKEIITSGTYTIIYKVKGQIYFDTTRSWKIWIDGDASDTPSYDFDPGYTAGFLEIGDVDNDGKNELVTPGRVLAWNGNGFTEEAKLTNIGGGGLTIADADNDEKNELIVGMGTRNDVVDRLGHGIVVKYVNGAYSVVGDLGPANTIAAIDEVSVGDLDGDGKNELFGSGYCKGNIYIWKYDGSAYKQVWTAQETNTEFHQSNEIADVNGDGKNEIAFGELNDLHLVVYKYDGNNKWSRLGSYENCVGMQMDVLYSYDFDGEGDMELLAMHQVWDWDGSAMTKVQTLMTDTGAGDTSLA